MYAFQLSFPFPGIAPAFLNIVQNRKILRNDLIIHCFWQQFQPTMFPSLFFLNSLADYTLKQISSLIQLKDNKSAKGSNRESVHQPVHTDFLKLTLQTVKRIQKTYWCGVAQMQELTAQARATQDSITANDTAPSDCAKKFFSWVHIHAQVLYMDYTC